MVITATKTYLFRPLYLGHRRRLTQNIYLKASRPLEWVSMIDDNG
jgi:hypothetical protein